jgi:predicted ATPase
VIESIQFRGFRILENAELKLGPFNLLLGPNGSGKTTAVRALVVLGKAARALVANETPEDDRDLAGATLEVSFGGGFAGAKAVLTFDKTGCPKLVVDEGGASAKGVARWLAGLSSYVLNPVALGRPVANAGSVVLDADGSGFPLVLKALREKDSQRWFEFVAEVGRVLPEVADVNLCETDDGRVCYTVTNSKGLVLRPDNLSQGTLVIIALVALAMDGARPTFLCLEEIERGIHPRLLRDVRDTLYRLSFPQDCGDSCAPVQVVVTTHSPYLLDLFADNPEDVVLATKDGESATFRKLSDVPELAEMLENGRLGDLWYSGILGGVP